MSAATAVRPNVRVMEQVYEAFGRGDIPAVLDAFDPGIEWVSAAFAHVWTLRDGRIVRYRQYVDSRKLAEAL